MKTRYVATELRQLIGKLKDITAYSVTPLRSERMINTIQREKLRVAGKVAQKRLDQAIAKYEKYLIGQKKRREIDVLMRLVGLAEWFAETLRKRLATLQPPSKAATVLEERQNVIQGFFRKREKKLRAGVQ